ncbi:elongation of very long chain fatty acids protein [Nesidiocoris tenuis]|uniref:Elongation of very long chain fatty acids protein n=1 Tax=Nesidiocoris tenuis TaxID=355587 RepID=A0ABN7APZ7_9HEMI|nr:elongation of very long chain fatty acids protein [Nesidiocoris tenuis]
MAQALIELYDAYNKFLDENIDPRTRHLPLIDPISLIVLLGGYMYLISSLGPRLMKNRQPMQLNKFMHCYNALQVLTNIWIVYIAFTEVWIPRRYEFWCEGADLSYEPGPLLVVRMTYVYFLLKVLDFVDTMIMVLRKKDEQASFLHKYHHVLVCFGAWMTTAILPGGSQVVFFGTMNCSIHAVMYSYYSATIINPELRQCKYKRHLTEAQIIQFVLSGIHAIIGYFHPTCSIPKWALMAFIPQDIFMIALFSDFYIKAYIKPKKQKKKRVE